MFPWSTRLSFGMIKATELRLFISSTFRDMQDEREVLVKKVFPEIRALCRKRGVTFTEVDLRWGLTDQDVVLGQVIGTCLEEIDKCRPYFIGLVGERYGWAPELLEYYKDPTLFVRWPWLEDAAMDGASITDIEFRHGALNDPENAGSARFFVRDLEARPPADGVDPALEELKERLRLSGLPITEYDRAESLGRQVFDALVRIIDQDFADALPRSILEEERSRHEAFAASRRHAYIPNAEYLTYLATWMNSGGQPLILYAESGSGKSSLLSFWCQQQRRRQPDLHIIEHYVGIGAGEADHLAIIRHIMLEIKERYGRAEDLPATPRQLEQQFANWLGFGLGAPMLVVIDGINQLTGHDLDLHWLPSSMPEGVALIVASTVDRTLVSLRKRGWQELAMQPLREEEREAVVVLFLAEYSKALAPGQIRRVAQDPKSAHPLFLRTLLEELRLHGEHEALEDRLDALLSTTGTEDLFQNVLARFEADYSEDVVQNVLSLLYASRSGLTEEEIEALTGFSRLQLSRMLFGLDYHLVRRDGILSFFHDYLRRAVGKRYLPSPEDHERCREHIARYFGTAGSSSRESLELLHALDGLGRRDAIEEVLVDVDRFVVLWEREKEEVLRLWSTAPVATIVEKYDEGLRSWEASPGTHDAEQSSILLKAIYDLFFAFGMLRYSEEISRKLVAHCRSVGNKGLEAGSLSALAFNITRQGRSSEGLELVQEAEILARELDDANRIAHAVGVRGVVHAMRGENDEALSCFREQEKIARSLDDRRRTGTAVSHRGNIHRIRGEYDEALACYSEQEDIGREIGDRGRVARSIGSRAGIYLRCGDYVEALACYREEERIAREIGDRGEIADSVGNRGLIHAEKGEYDEALACYRTQEQLCRELGDVRVAMNAVGNRGMLHAEFGEFKKALDALRDATESHRAIDFFEGVTSWTEGMVLVFVEILESETDEMPTYLSEYLPDIALDSWRQQVADEAKRIARECYEISDRISRQITHVGSRILLARISALCGAVDEARSIFEGILDEELGLAQQAHVRYRLGKLGASDAHHRAEALRLYRAIIEQTPHHLYRRRLDELETEAV